MRLSIVIPVYNERQTIAQVLRECHAKIVTKLPQTEIIVVDDGSDDGTKSILQDLAQELSLVRIVALPNNLGHGGAVRAGYEAAKGEWIFQVDSDAQFDIGDFWRLWQARKQADFILGYREKRKDPLLRRWLSGIFGVVLSILFKVRIRDANCPFRLMKRSLVIKYLQKIEKVFLAPNAALAVLACRDGCLRQVGVRHSQREQGKGKLVKKKLLIYCIRGFTQFYRWSSDLS